jgi:hypothetical protein
VWDSLAAAGALAWGTSQGDEWGDYVVGFDIAGVEVVQDTSGTGRLTQVTKQWSNTHCKQMTGSQEACACVVGAVGERAAEGVTLGAEEGDGVVQ